jgi:hypothetical protein
MLIYGGGIVLAAAIGLKLRGQRRGTAAKKDEPGAEDLNKQPVLAPCASVKNMIPPSPAAPAEAEAPAKASLSSLASSREMCGRMGDQEWATSMPGNK